MPRMKIQQICSSFLWKGKDSSAQGARVRWSDLCYPEIEGELDPEGLVHVEHNLHLKTLHSYQSLAPCGLHGHNGGRF